MPHCVKKLQRLEMSISSHVLVHACVTIMTLDIFMLLKSLRNYDFQFSRHLTNLQYLTSFLRLESPIILTAYQPCFSPILLSGVVFLANANVNIYLFFSYLT